MEAASGIVSAPLRPEGGEWLAREPTEENVVPYHVVEGSRIEDVGVQYDCPVARWKVASVLLDNSGIVVESNSDGDAKCD